MIPHEEYQQYYYRPDAKFKIITYTKCREVAILKPKGVQQKEYGMRLFTISSVQDIDWMFRFARMRQNSIYYNLYHSVAKYEYGSFFCKLDTIERAAFKEKWLHEHWKHMTAYDFFIDIDGDFIDFDITHSSALLIMDFLNDLGVPFRCRFSGKGFHFIVPHEHFIKTLPPEWQSFDVTQPKNIYLFFARTARYFYDSFSELVDTCIYDPRRLVKIPYSLSIYEHDSYICHPINTVSEMMDFSLSEASYTKWEGKIRDHTDELHNPTGNTQQIVDLILPIINKEVETDGKTK